MIENHVCDSDSYGCRKLAMTRLDIIPVDNEIHVYCSCGRVVALDRSEMELKMSLRKPLQCSVCRNQRISQEIDYLNDLYNGVIAEESF